MHVSQNKVLLTSFVFARQLVLLSVTVIIIWLDLTKLDCISLQIFAFHWMSFFIIQYNHKMYLIIVFFLLPSINSIYINRFIITAWVTRLFEHNWMFSKFQLWIPLSRFNLSPMISNQRHLPFYYHFTFYLGPIFVYIWMHTCVEHTFNLTLFLNTTISIDLTTYCLAVVIIVVSVVCCLSKWQNWLLTNLNDDDG